MALSWKAMKDGYNRTTGYVTKLADGTSVYIRNTGGRRSTGTWLTYINFGPAQITLDRSCSLGSAKSYVEACLGNVTVFQATDGDWFASQPTAAGNFKHTLLGSDRQIRDKGQAIKRAFEMRLEVQV